MGRLDHRRTAQSSAVVLKRDGQWTDYNDRPRYRLRRGAKLDPDKLHLATTTQFGCLAPSSPAYSPNTA